MFWVAKVTLWGYMQFFRPSNILSVLSVRQRHPATAPLTNHETSSMRRKFAQQLNHGETQMSLLQKLQAISTALTDILTKTAQVQTALEDLDTFLGTVA